MTHFSNLVTISPSSPMTKNQTTTPLQQQPARPLRPEVSFHPAARFEAPPSHPPCAQESSRASTSECARADPARRTVQAGAPELRLWLLKMRRNESLPHILNQQGSIDRSPN